MTKLELIERYGLEWYEQHKAKTYARWKERYHNDPEFRESYNARSCAYAMKRYHNDPEFRKSVDASTKARKKERYHNDPEYREYVKSSSKACQKARYVEDGRIDLIMNYELAAKDNLEGWEIHHRLELHPDGTVRFTRQSLIKLNLYYNRPPSELIWLRSTEHSRIHSKGRERTQRGNLWI